MEPVEKTLAEMYFFEKNHKRSTRAEVWWSLLFQLVVFWIVIEILKAREPYDEYRILGTIIVSGFIYYIWNMNLIVRRLHDINAGPTLAIIAAIPLFTSLILLGLGFIPSDPADNKWGKYTIWDTGNDNLLFLIPVGLYFIVHGGGYVLGEILKSYF